MGRLRNWFVGAEGSEASKKNLRNSRILYAFAWLVEAFAVTTGLVIAYMVGWSTYNENLQIAESGESVTSFANVIIASLPFVLVAVVELAKIPTASAVYVTKNIIWKTLFAVMLVFLAIITFETALNGFERNFNNLNFQVNKVREKLDAENTQIQRLRSAILEADTLTREGIYENFEAQNTVFAQSRDAILEEIRQEESVIKNLAQNSQARVLQDQIDELKAERKNLLARKEKEIETTIASLDESRDSQLADLDRTRDELSSQASKLQANIDKLSAQRTQEYENKLQQLRVPIERLEDELANLEFEKRKQIDASFFNKGSIERKFEELIKSKRREIRAAESKRDRLSPEDTLANRELQKEREKLEIINAKITNFSSSSVTVTELEKKTETLGLIEAKYSRSLAKNQSEINALNEQLSKVAGISENDAKTQRTIVNKKREEALAKYDLNFQQISTVRDEQLEVLKEKELKISEYRVEIEERLKSVSELKTEINKRASNNQVFRIAMMFEPEANTAADVSKATVDMVGKIWFGSLALVIAITGITLALASEVIADERQTNQNQKDLPKRKSSLRSLAMAIHKSRKKRPKSEVKHIIKEVIKEVPVDKVVFRDVVKEVVKKEVVHVPIYTNDKKLLNED